jgi:hypothetical protein
MRNGVAATLLMLACCALLIAQTSVQRLRDVKKVYVGSFGDAFAADVIRNKLISHLVKSGRVEVVENPDQADAILTGASQVTDAAATESNTHGGRTYHATAGVRLLNRDSKILWADDTTNGIFARSVTSSIADKIAKKLLKAIAEDANPK